MAATIGLVANVYNEANALPGWLETHLPFFDDVRVLHAGPGGQYSDDGTMEILEKWNIPVLFTDINLGFGIVRTQALRMSPCDYVMLLDADERFYPIVNYRELEGHGTPQHEVDWILQSYDFSGVNLPNWENVERLGQNLVVRVREPVAQGQHLRNLVDNWVEYSDDRPDAIVTIRRHWHDLGMRRPTQSWLEHPDWQLRLVRRDSTIYFDPNVRMHERLIGAHHTIHSDNVRGPFFDHFHFHFKRMEQEQRRHDVAIYNAIHERKPAPMKRGGQ